MTNSLLVAICLLILAANVAGLVQAQVGRVQANHQQILAFETGSDTFFNSPVNGSYQWYLSIANQESSPITGTGIEIASDYSQSSCRYMNPRSTSVSQRGAQYLYDWVLGTSAPNNEAGINLSCGPPVTFYPGFDSQRKISPEIFDTKAANVTVSITVTPRKALALLRVAIDLSAPSTTAPLIIAESAVPNNPFVQSDLKFMSWNINKPVLNQAYQFSVNLSVSNPLYSKYYYKPRVIVNSFDQAPEQIIRDAPMFVAQDKILGTITYSVGSYHEWSYNHQIMNRIVHTAISGNPTVSIIIQKPISMSVLSRIVNITALANSSTGNITSLQYRIDSTEWAPMNVADLLGRSNGFVLWDTRAVANGIHNITIRASDSNGVNQVNSFIVIVDNSESRFTGYLNSAQLTQFAGTTAIVAAILAVSWFLGRRKESQVAK